MALAAAAAVAGCEMDWGGASLELEDPAPADTAAEADGPDDGAGAEPVPELPEGPLLYVARLDTTGRARAAPAARLSDGELAGVDWPADPPSVYLERFDSTFQRPGFELPLLAHGGRTGSLVLDDRRTPAGGCPPVAGGEALLPAGQGPPEFAFAASPRDTAAAGGLVRGPTSTTSRIRTFAPILAERILGEAGVEQTFLARQVDLRAVAMPGDTAPGMAATFLIRDSLTAAPPPSSETSTSLFVLARFDRSDGYVPVWTRIRRYDSGADKEILTHLGWISSASGPLHLVRRTTTDGSRLAAFRTGDGTGTGELVWVEPGGCPALEALDRSTPRPAAPAAGDTAP